MNRSDPSGIGSLQFAGVAGQGSSSRIKSGVEQKVLKSSLNPPSHLRTDRTHEAEFFGQLDGGAEADNLFRSSQRRVIDHNWQVRPCIVRFSVGFYAFLNIVPTDVDNYIW
jgi:hypothetical protein